MPLSCTLYQTRHFFASYLFATATSRQTARQRSFGSTKPTRGLENIRVQLRVMFVSY